jgi:tetratricopeptide (TPR) repeat protein
MKGDLETAVRNFEKALELDRNFIPAFHQLGKAYYRMGQPGRASRLLEEVVARKPRQVAPRLDLGYAYLAQNRYPESREQFSAVMETDPDNARAHVALGQVAFAEGQWAQAAQHAQIAANQGGAGFSSLFLLGRAARLTGNVDLSNQSLDQAEKVLEQSLEMNPDQPEPWFLRGEVRFARDSLGQALEAYNEALPRAQPGHYYGAFGETFTRTDIMAKQAACYQRLGRGERAREIAREILEHAPDHPQARALADQE